MGMFVVGLITSIVTFLVSEFVILKFFGPEYEASIEVLKIYSLANIPVFIGVAHGLWMVHEKKLIISLYKAAFGALISLTLCLLLVPKYGLVGAAFSSVISLFLVDMILPILLYPKIFKELIFIYPKSKALK
jgi:PST family polysaccharide transporter